MQFVRLILILLLIAATSIAFGQDRNSKLGLFAGYNSLEPSANATVSDRYYISGGSGIDGYELGLFGSLIKKRWYWEGQISYLTTRSGLSITNLKWQEDLVQYGAAEVSGGIGITNRMVRLSLNRGFFVTRNFSLEAGVVGIIQIDDPHYKNWPAEDYYDWQKDMSNTVFEFGRSLNKFMLSAEASAAYYFGPLKITFALEGNVTPVTSKVAYHGQRYPVKYDYLMWTFGISYSIFDSKK